MPQQASPCSWIGTGGVQDVQFITQGTRIITDGPAGVRIYDATTGAPLQVLPSRGALTTPVRMSADSTRAAYFIYEYAAVWNVADGTLINSFDSTNTVNMALSPDGKTLALALRSGVVTVWNVDSGMPSASFMAHTLMPVSLLFSPDGKVLVTSDGSAVRFWSTDGYDLLFESPSPNDVSDYRALAAFSPDGRYLVTEAGEIFRASDGALLEVADGLDNTSLFAGFAADGASFFVAMRSNGAVPGTLYTKSLGAMGWTTTKTRTVTAPFDTLTVSPDGQHMVLGTLKAETLKSFPLDDAMPDWSIDAGLVRLQGAVVAKTMLATIDGAGQGQVWDLDHHTVLKTFQTKVGYPFITKMAVSPAGDRLAWEDDVSGNLVVWDVAGNRSVASFKAIQGDEGLLFLSFAPDGSRIATCNSRNAAHLWSADDGSKIADLPLTSLEDFPQIVFTGDGDSLVVADGTLDVFDAHSGARTHHWMMSGTPSPVVSSPGGALLAIATYDGWLTILDSQSWSLPIATRMRRSSTGASVALTPGGDRVVTFDDQYTATVWRTADLVGTAAFQPVNEDGIGFLGAVRLSDGSEQLITQDGYDVIEMWCLPPP